MKRSLFLPVAVLLVLAVMPLVLSAQTHGKRYAYAYGRHHTSLIGRRDRGLHKGWVRGRYLGWYKNGKTPPAMSRTNSGILSIEHGRGHGRGAWPRSLILSCFFSDRS